MQVVIIAVPVQEKLSLFERYLLASVSESRQFTEHENEILTCIGNSMVYDLVFEQTVLLVQLLLLFLYFSLHLLHTILKSFPFSFELFASK